MADRVQTDESTIADTASADTQVPTDRFDRPLTAPLQLAGYEIGEVIGRGGMGEVMAATDLRIEREVAVKRLYGKASPEAIERFLREAKIQARLDHPAIPPVHELGRDNEGRPFFTMKRLAGTTLLDKLREDGPIQPLLRAFVDVCFAIELAHQRGIVHRDLKPANIMLGDYNEVYVLDWGVARVLHTQRTSSVSIEPVTDEGMTKVGAVLGTPGYMAPEQMRGEDVGTAADVYSLGAILFEILAGETLHPRGEAMASTLANPTASPARRTSHQVPPELDALCTEALAADPRARPTARSLAERVQRYLDGDRDAELRRDMSRRELDIARDALASGEGARRRLAAQSAARAFAFDPTSREAADLVARIVLEPPPEEPPDLVASFDAVETELIKERSRRSVFAFLAIWLWLPFVFVVEISSWLQVFGLFASCTAMAALAWHNSRTGKVSWPLLLLGNTAVVVMFSRLGSPFAITPSVVCGMLLALSTHRTLETHKWMLALWAAFALSLPLVLEWTGVLAPTWRVEPDGLLMWSSIDKTHGTADLVSLIFGQTALGVVVAVYSSSFARTTREAQRRAHRQAWHLQQMLPRGSSQLT